MAQDWARAYIHFNIAAARATHPEAEPLRRTAERHRDRMAARLPRDQLAVAQEEARRRLDAYDRQAAVAEAVGQTRTWLDGAGYSAAEWATRQAGKAARLHALLTFTELPDAAAVTARAHALAALAAAHGATAAMIGGAPFLMAPLCHALLNAGIQPLFAFSQRRVEEHRRPDGTVERVEAPAFPPGIDGAKGQYIRRARALQ